MFQSVKPTVHCLHGGMDSQITRDSGSYQSRNKADES
jgi:hypothetical protein